MQAIKIIDTVTDKGVYLNTPELIKYINKKVEIIILPIEENENQFNILDFAGKFDNETYKYFKDTLCETRKIDIGEW